MMFKRTAQIISVALVLSFSATSWADHYVLSSFNITGNDSEDAAIGEAQIVVTVHDPGNNQVLFTIENSGTDSSSITDVYFDDGVLLGIASIDNSDPNVMFHLGATPEQLPGGNDYNWETGTAGGSGYFSVEPDNPQPDNGINPGESLGILFDIDVSQYPNATFADVIAQLTSGDIRVGVRMQAYANPDGSEGFIINQIPAPAALVLGMVGLGMVGWMRRRFA